MVSSLFKWLAVMGFCLNLQGPADLGALTNGRVQGLDNKHPLYISVTEIRHNAKDKILEVSCKMFSSDLETALEKAFKTKVDVTATATKAAVDKMITDYVSRHLKLKVDGKQGVLNFVGREEEQDGTWCYFQVNDMAAVPHQINVTDELLYDSFNQQINILHVTVGDNRKSTRLDYPDAGAVFTF